MESIKEMIKMTHPLKFEIKIFMESDYLIDAKRSRFCCPEMKARFARGEYGVFGGNIVYAYGFIPPIKRCPFCGRALVVDIIR